MTTYTYGEMFDTVDFIRSIPIVTTNGYIRSDGRLAMGRGAARTLAGFDDVRIPLALAEQITMCGESQDLGLWKYPPIFAQVNGIGVFGAFQTKLHFQGPSDLSLIVENWKALLWTLHHSPLLYHLNFPGIGFGQLPPLEVYQAISALPHPDNLVVWTRHRVPGIPYPPTP